MGKAKCSGASEIKPKPDVQKTLAELRTRMDKAEATIRGAVAEISAMQTIFADKDRNLEQDNKENRLAINELQNLLHDRFNQAIFNHPIQPAEQAVEPTNKLDYPENISCIACENWNGQHCKIKELCLRGNRFVGVSEKYKPPAEQDNSPIESRPECFPLRDKPCLKCYWWNIFDKKCKTPSPMCYEGSAFKPIEQDKPKGGE